MKISILGMGFVGTAVYNGLSPYADIKMYDKFRKGFHSLEEAVEHSKFLFVCIPTPMGDDGVQDQAALYDVIGAAADAAMERKTFVIKSTILPGTSQELQKEFPAHSIVFSPEFLTERTALMDFINSARFVFGFDSQIAGEDLRPLLKLFEKRFPASRIYRTSTKKAELLKYACNCFFAAKVSFMNEMYELCSEEGINYEMLKAMMLGDQRIGNSHMDVPGPDGHLGYGGKCFPKDIAALVKWGERRGLPMTMFNAAMEVNERVRDVRDWEDIKGATTKNNY